MTVNEELTIINYHVINRLANYDELGLNISVNN